MDAIVKLWEYETSFNTEATYYSALYSRDVNNYIAIKTEGGFKAKGVYGNVRLSKNPQNQICIESVVDFITKGTPIAGSIYNCKDIQKFANVRTVKGGAVKVWSKKPLPAFSCQEELVWLAGFVQAEGGTYRHPSFEENLANFSLQDAFDAAKDMLQVADRIEYLGKAIRWYYANDVVGEIVYAMSGNKVSLSDGAQPMMDLPKEFPTNIDYEWYERKANESLAEIGYC